MATRRVIAGWGGPGKDILTLIINAPLPPYGASITDDDRVVLYRLLDDREEATGPIVGIEIDDFLGIDIAAAGFDGWDSLPALPERWQQDGREPLLLTDLLKLLQAELQARARTLVRA